MMMVKNDERIQHILDFCRTAYSENEYPALLKQYREWSKNRPLAGVRILDSTPLFRNTLLKYVPLLAAGAELTAATTDHLPYDAALPPLLKQWGLPYLHNGTSGDYDCILDCNGEHAAFHARYGFAELTRSGFYHFQDCQYPVILVDDSRIKAIETCLGTGDGFLRGMRQCGYTDFRGKSLVVFGFGKVGRGIAFYANREGAKVTAVDNAETRAPEYVQLIDRQDTDRMLNAVRSAWCVVTATGIEYAMRSNGTAGILRDSTQIVAAMGIEDEWGDSLPAERILNHGQPLNFLCSEPTRLRYIDPTMALSNAAALELVKKTLPAGIQKIDPAVEAYYWQAVEQQGLITNELKESGI